MTGTVSERRIQGGPIKGTAGLVKDLRLYSRNSGDDYMMFAFQKDDSGGFMEDWVGSGGKEQMKVYLKYLPKNLSKRLLVCSIHKHGEKRNREEKH